MAHFLVMSDLPQFEGVIRNGVNSRLVPPGDVQALADALLWVAERPGLRKKALSVGREYVHTHADRKIQTDFVINIYDELLSG